MATEGSAPAGDKSGDEDGDGDASAGEGSLFSLYRQYVGEPESDRDVYVGFGAFFGGIALGIVGLALFLYSGTQPTGSDVFWQLREVALVFTMLAVPAVGVSVAVLLPVGRLTMAASLLGTGVCILGATWLTYVYPYQWTATGNDVSVLSTYAIGVVMLAASTGSSLVAQYVDSVAPRERGTDEGDADERDSSETVSDDQVAEDIEDAMSDSSLTWGGVEQEPNTKRLELDMPESPEIDQQNVESATETRSSGEDVDDAVSGLRQLQGGDKETERAESPDDQVDALTEFRRQQEDEDLETGVDADQGLLAWLRKKLFG